MEVRSTLASSAQCCGSRAKQTVLFRPTGPHQYSAVATSNNPTLVVSFKPYQSAQARELASMRNARYQTCGII